MPNTFIMVLDNMTSILFFLTSNANSKLNLSAKSVGQLFVFKGISPMIADNLLNIICRLVQIKSQNIQTKKIEIIFLNKPHNLVASLQGIFSKIAELK